MLPITADEEKVFEEISTTDIKVNYFKLNYEFRGKVPPVLKLTVEEHTLKQCETSRGRYSQFYAYPDYTDNALVHSNDILNITITDSEKETKNGFNFPRKR